MFNYGADQIFVLQPRNAGGGILSYLLSLDNNTASTDFKKITVLEKLQRWDNHVSKGNRPNAHVSGFVNFAGDIHRQNIIEADWCSRYVHKHHFFELDEINDKKCQALLDDMSGEKKSVGIYITDACLPHLCKRYQRFGQKDNIDQIDYYQKWIYSNQKKLLKDFYGITSVHHFPFVDMLDLDTFIDHIKYCKDLLELDLDLDTAAILVADWHKLL